MTLYDYANLRIDTSGGGVKFFCFFLNVLFLNIFRITPGLPNVTEWW